MSLQKLTTNKGEYMTDTLIQWILGFMASNPHFAVLLTVMSFLRLVFKPTCSLIQLYVDATPSVKDNAWWLKFQDNKVFKAVAYAVDYFLSVKLPK